MRGGPCLAVVLLLLLAGAIHGAPVAISPGDLSGSATSITFAEVAPGDAIDIQYLAQGVIFVPGLFGALDPDSSAPAATNTGGTNPITLLFTEPVLRLGFDIRFPGGASLLTLTVLDETLAPAGDVAFLPGTSYEFAGLQDHPAFHGLWIATPDEFLLANLRFETVPVPEPAALYRAAAACAALWWGAGRRRRRKL